MKVLLVDGRMYRIASPTLLATTTYLWPWRASTDPLGIANSTSDSNWPASLTLTFWPITIRCCWSEPRVSVKIGRRKSWCSS